MRVTADLRPEHYQLLAQDARAEYRRLPEQAAYVIAQALASRTNAPPERGHSESAAAADTAALSVGENDARQEPVSSEF